MAWTPCLLPLLAQAALASEGEPPPPEDPAPEVVASPRNGRGYVVAWGAAATGYGSVALASVAGVDELSPLTAISLGGSLVGMGSALILTRNAELDQAEGLFVAGVGLESTWAAHELARVLIPEGADLREQRIAAAGALGAMAGTGLGVLVLDRAPSPVATSGLIVGTGVGWATGAGLGGVFGRLNTREQAGVELAAGAITGAVSLAVWPRLKEPPKFGAVALNLGHGVWLGSWAPYLRDDSPSEEDVLYGALIGVGLGYLGTVATAGGSQAEGSVTLQLVGAHAGAALGAGIPLAAGRNGHPSQVLGPMMLGSVAGQAAGLLVAPRYDLTGNDAALLGITEAWTLWQTAGWGWYGELQGGGSKVGGHALLTYGAGTLTAFALPAATDLSGAQAVNAGLFGGWGTWYGAWIPQVADVPADEVWLGTLLGGDLAIIGATVAAAAGLDPSWRQTGVLHGAGAVGAGVGALAGVVISPELDTVGTAALIGSTAGLIGGVFIIATREELSRGHGDVPEGPGLALGQLPVRAQVGVAPWLGEDGKPGLQVTVDLTQVTPGALGL